MVDLGDTNCMTSDKTSDAFIHSTQLEQQAGEDQSKMPFTPGEKSVAGPILNLRKRVQFGEPIR